MAANAPPAGAPAPPPGWPTPPWAVEPGEALELLGVDPALGLDDAEVESRRRRHGANELAAEGARPWWGILLDQFRSVLVLLLVAAAALSALSLQFAEAGAILVVLVLNAGIGYVTELRAVRSVEALKRLGTTRCRVRRAGRLEVLGAEELVPGDVLLLEAGELIGADARVLRASRLETNESSLTGEAVPVAKDPRPVPPASALHERSPMLYRGTHVTRGAGEAVVVATGSATELGRIGSLVERAAPGGTPLEARLGGLARGLVWVALGAAVLVTLTGIGSGKGWFLLLQTAIALAVATVPEGLPIIATLTLAQGVRRMARRNALVNRLAAVETLGATSVIITDKTGTLTENRLRVTELWLPSGRVALPEEPAGQTAAGPGAAEPRTPGLGEELRHALTAAALCVTAELPAAFGAEDGDAVGVGDPLELALLRAARREGIEREGALQRYPELRQEAFDADTRLMATTHLRRGGTADGAWVIVKGAPGEVIRAATGVATVGGESREELSDAERERWLGRNRLLAGDGLRVLALAERVSAEPPEAPYEDLALIGLVALSDPPREGVEEALAGCAAAGIRVVVATGDQAVTARSVAENVGLDVAGGVLDGRAVAELLDAGEAGEGRLLSANVLARLTPEQKLRLIELHQRAGAVVAMTGDGVNDAPALRRADIGVAMGLRGTDVAREAADMVLLDDAFGTILAAVKEGRVIFDAIRAFVIYLLSCNLSEVMVIGLAGLAGYPLPLLPLQILFLNLVTDVLPALALGAGRGDLRILERPPRSRTEPLVARRHWWTIVGYGSILTLSTLGAFLLAFRLPGATSATAITVAFLTLALGQVWHVFNMRDPGSSLVNNQATRNRWVWAATFACTAGVGVAVAVPALRDVLGVELLGARGWGLVAAAGLFPLVVGQVGKAVGLGRVS